MTATAILKAINALPTEERMKIVEQVIRTIRLEKPKKGSGKRIRTIPARAATRGLTIHATSPLSRKLYLKRGQIAGFITTESTEEHREIRSVISVFSVVKKSIF